MQILSITMIVALASLVLALPYDTDSFVVKTCERASNCETYARSNGGIGTHLLDGRDLGASSSSSGDEDANITEVEVVPYNHNQKRDTFPNSKFLFGDTKLYWGCDVDPIKEIDHVSDICITEQCDQTKDYTRSIDYLDINKGGNPGAPSQKTLKLKANGFCKTPNRNALVKALQTAAGSKGLIKWHRGVEWAEAGTEISRGVTTGTKRGKCDGAEFTNTIGINLWAAQDNIVASIQANFEIGEQSANKGFCKATDVGASVAGAFGPGGAVAAPAFLGGG